MFTKLIVAIGDVYTLLDPGAGRFYIHLCILSAQTFNIYSQLRYLFYPEFKWFDLNEVLKGNEPPSHIGIYDPKLMKNLVKRAELFYKMAKWIYHFGKLQMVSLYVGVAIWLHEETWELYYIIVANSWIFMWKDIFVASLVWQMAYFHTGAFYFRQELLQVSNWIENLSKRLVLNAENRIESILLSKFQMNRIYKTLMKIRNQVIVANSELGL